MPKLTNSRTVVKTIISFVDMLTNAGLISYQIGDKLEIKLDIFNALEKHITPEE